jgi:tRNA G46 methylase TrmB
MSAKIDAARANEPIDPASAKSKVSLFDPVGTKIFAHWLGFWGSVQVARYHGKVMETPQTEPEHANPAVLTTDQSGCHPDLEKIVLNHLRHPWRKPCPAHTRVAFEQLRQRLATTPRPLILDSFCGTGMSTAVIAEQHPEAWVVGIDQSAHRLAKHQPSGADNYLLLQAEAESFWQCLAEAGIGLYGHWLLYPNPWPKANQFKRRVHGHGAFATLARLGGDVELRTNWDIYAQEFFQAASLIGLSGELETVIPVSPMTLFELKYQQRGQTLWRFRGQCAN